MKFFTIPPTEHLELTTINDNYFCLAPLCHNAKYLEFFTDKAANNKYVILDNGAAEGHTMEGDEYLRLICTLKPTVAVAPDVIGRGEQTLMALERFKFDLQSCQNWNPSLRDIMIMGVPQGSTIKLWLECFLHMVNDPFISIIGVSKFAVMAFYEMTGSLDVATNRVAAIEFLHKYNLNNKRIHCLGMRDPREFEAYKSMPLVLSSDSAFTVLAASMGQSVFDCDTSVATPPEYFHMTFDQVQYELAIKNIKELNELYCPSIV